LGDRAIRALTLLIHPWKQPDLNFRNTVEGRRMGDLMPAGCG